MLHHRKRILIIGSGGAGKSTFARELAARTGLPLIHLDRHYWKPGWTPTPAEEWTECVRRLSSGESWVMDGNYGGSLPARVGRCDAVVFFDMPRLLCVWGVVRRWIESHFKERTDIPEGCPERLNVEFVRWVWDFPKNSRPRIAAALERCDPETEIVTITRREDVRKILAAVSQNTTGSRKASGMDA